MDVRITYAVDLDKVPEKVADMLMDVDKHKAGHLIDLAVHMIELGHHDMGSTLIDDARKKLAIADRKLTEAQMILSGYTDAKKEPEEPVAPTPEPANAD